MSGLYLLICTESAPPIGSNNLLFYTEESWRSGAGLFLAARAANKCREIFNKKTVKITK